MTKEDNLDSCALAAALIEYSLLRPPITRHLRYMANWGQGDDGTVQFRAAQISEGVDRGIVSRRRHGHFGRSGRRQYLRPVRQGGRDQARRDPAVVDRDRIGARWPILYRRSEEHTPELQ